MEYFNVSAQYVVIPLNVLHHLKLAALLVDLLD
jgi:hypothetical protein